MKKIKSFLCFVRNYFVSYAFQFSRLRWPKMNKMISMFLILLLFFAILGGIIFGLEKALREFFRLIKLYV